MITYTIDTLEDLDKVASRFLRRFSAERKFVFFGEMGVGKTTFIKALCNHLQVQDTVASPTFAIVNEYQTKSNDKVYHFDFYRISHVEEVFDLGYEEYFYSTDYCFVEWPERIEGMIPENFVHVHLKLLPGLKRIVSASAPT